MLVMIVKFPFQRRVGGGSNSHRNGFILYIPLWYERGRETSVLMICIREIFVRSSDCALYTTSCHVLSLPQSRVMQSYKNKSTGIVRMVSSYLHTRRWPRMVWWCGAHTCVITLLCCGIVWWICIWLYNLLVAVCIYTCTCLDASLKRSQNTGKSTTSQFNNVACAKDSDKRGFSNYISGIYWVHGGASGGTLAFRFYPPCVWFCLLCSPSVGCESL